MTTSVRAEELIESNNPFFNKRKLKLGTFSSNNSGGAAMSTIDGVLKADWASSLDLARVADSMEFEAIVPVGRWKGFGGLTDFNGWSLEVFTWAAAIAASTKYCGVFATSHISTMHPLLAAKQATTIDHISNGRFGLNVVTGYNQAELEMFGSPMLSHETRYAQADEWLRVVKELWTNPNEFAFDGDYYHIKGGYLKPKPIQTPHPVVMCAGLSEAGRHFSAKNCDLTFIVAESHDFESMKKRVDSYKTLAHEEYGRQIAVWAHAYIVQGDTEKDARDYFRYYVDEHGDWEAATNVVNSLIANTKDWPAEVLRKQLRDFIAGWGGYPLVGTKDQIVEKLAMLSKAGVDGMLLTWPRYQDDMRQFREETYPLLVQAGLR